MKLPNSVVARIISASLLCNSHLLLSKCDADQSTSLHWLSLPVISSARRSRPENVQKLTGTVFGENQGAKSHWRFALAKLPLEATIGGLLSPRKRAVL